MKSKMSDHPLASEEFHPRTGWYATRNLFPLLARIFLSAIFIWAGINKIMNPAMTQAYMAQHHIPFTGFFIIITIAVEIFGGLSVLFGVKTRWGAAALALFLIPATLIFHTDFGMREDTTAFMKNLAILGGLLMLIQYGPAGIVVRGRNLT
jgi:putative oxidoreductase